MCGSATLAIVESSTVMNDASMMTQVISSGLAVRGMAARGTAMAATRLPPLS